MKKITALLLALLISILLFPACRGEEPDAEAIRVMTLNGTTGFGMAPLMTENDAGTRYQFTVEKDPEIATKALINGSVDICALPTNVAAKLYNRTGGEVVLLALNTGGVLHLVCNTQKATPPTTLAELSGKTVYCPQSPSYIAKAILQKAGLTDVTLDLSYAQPAALQKALLAGEIAYAILPEPLVTAVTEKAPHLVPSLDLTAVWEQYFPAGSLTQGCVVARKSFLTARPETVAAFLREYEASIRFVIEQPAEAALRILRSGVFEGDAAIAEKAIPRCHFCYIAGAPMQAAMSAFLSAVPLAEIGGALPNDDFYYNAK